MAKALPGEDPVMKKNASSDEDLVALADIDSEDRQAMMDLLLVLEEETEIATKTKMNSDYVPGMVSVLHGDQLEALGIHTVVDALSLVPGVQVSRIASGEPTVKVRGFTYPFNAGNIKVMLNSIALSRESSGINSSVLLMPVAQVDRVEIIRGPGSSIYGDFAMAGVVNIITKKNGGKIYTGGGTDQSTSGGGHYAYEDKQKSLRLGLSASLSDDGKSASILDKNPDEERAIAVFHLDYKEFSLKFEGVKRDFAYDQVSPLPAGQPPPPPPPVGPGPQINRLTAEEKSWVTEARQKLTLGPAGLELYLSYLSNSGDLQEPNRKFNGDRIETGLEVAWEPLTGHEFLIGLSYAYSTINGASEPGGPSEPPGSMFSISNLDRQNYAMSIQDQVAVSDNFSLTLGLRYDVYDDVGDLLTPRIAGVYRLGENHVLKAQYSQGFRSPTFWELYHSGVVNEDLDFEVIETTELIYIYRQPGKVGRITLYSSEIDDGIYAEAGQPFDNYIKIRSKGAEVEWDQKITEKLRILTNVSYVKVEDDRWAQGEDDDSPGVANWLGNLAVFYEPLPKLMVTGRWLHVGDQYNFGNDVDGYDPIDLTISRRDLFWEGFTLRGGIKNLFDDKIAYTTQRPHGLSKDEFTRQMFWIQLSYEF